MFLIIKNNNKKKTKLINMYIYILKKILRKKILT